MPVPEPEQKDADADVAALAKKAYAAIDQMPSWPSFLHDWVKQQMQAGEEQGPEKIIDAVLKDSQGKLGLQDKSPELKARVKQRLLSSEHGAAELIRRHATGLP